MSDGAAALPHGVGHRRCAASAGAGVVSERGLDRAVGGGAGLGSRAAGLARAGRRMLRSCAESPTILRFLRDPVANAAAFSVDARMQHRGRGLPREVARCSLPVDRSTRKKNPSPPAPASGGSTTGYRLIRCRIHRPHAPTQNLGLKTQRRRILRQGRAQPAPETRSHPQARCRSRPSRRPPPAPAEAAQQRRHDHQGQRTSRTRPHLHQGRRARDGGGGRLVTR